MVGVAFLATLILAGCEGDEKNQIESPLEQLGTGIAE